MIEAPALKQVIPILRIFSVEEAPREFYLGFLGFHLHLSEHHGDACPGAAMMITIDAYHREFAGVRSHNAALRCAFPAGMDSV